MVLGMPKPVDLDYDPEKTEIHSVMVRMPAELHEAIKAQAAKSERSVAQTIRYALRQHLNA
jgi:predicted HicB family RNase H-like nuclease